MRYGTYEFRSDKMTECLSPQAQKSGSKSAVRLPVNSFWARRAAQAGGTPAPLCKGHRNRAHTVFAAGLILCSIFAPNPGFAQDTGEIDQLKRQLREMQENFERVQREQREQIDA